MADSMLVTIHSLLSPQDKAVLVSFKSGNPDWTLYPVAGIELLAAVQWKLLNIRKLKNTKFGKHSEQMLKLKQCLHVE